MTVVSECVTGCIFLILVLVLTCYPSIQTLLAWSGIESDNSAYCCWSAAGAMHSWIVEMSCCWPKNRHVWISIAFAWYHEVRLLISRYNTNLPHSQPWRHSMQGHPNPRKWAKTNVCSWHDTLKRPSCSNEMEIRFAKEEYDADQINLESTNMAVVEDKLPRDVLVVSSICMYRRISMLWGVHSNHDGEPRKNIWRVVWHASCIPGPRSG